MRVRQRQPQDHHYPAAPGQRHDDRVRNVEELTATPEPAWPALEAELLSSPQVTVLPVVDAAGRDCLYRLQVSTRSRLGALALHTGGLLVDDGWLRVLGGGGDTGLPSLAQANALPGDGRPPASLVVGHDVLGGRYRCCHSWARVPLQS
jgi:hypothetical protein